MKTINAALCSFGMSGKLFHAPFISCHPGINLYAIWERSKDIVKDYYPETKIYRTYEQLLDDPLIDLVIVNTPSYTHYEYATQALNASKNVIVEKPFTATLDQAKKLTALAAAKNVTLSVFQNRRWDSDFKTVKSIYESGILGEVLEAEFHYDRFNLALSPKAHKETPGPAVGVVYDLGPHLIDQALSLFGMPDKVFADIMKTRPQSLVDDYFEILLFYPHMRVRLKSGYHFREPIPSFVLYGSLGTFQKTRADVQETDLLAGKKPDSLDWGMEPDEAQGFLHTEKEGVLIKEHIPSLQGNYMEYYDAVYNSIISNADLPVTGYDGVNSTAVIEAAYKSAREQKIIWISEVL
jgi:predicted dehydrogenase